MRWAAGFLLVGAAVLKAAQLVSDPASALLGPLGQYLLPAQIGIEFAIGVLLLNSHYWRTLRWFVLVLFTGFAGYSLYLALSGAASCGCFGAVRVHPWWTFGLDSFVVLGVLVSVLSEHNTSSSESATIAAARAKHRLDRHQILSVAAGIVVLCAVLLIRFVDQRNAVAGGRSTARNSADNLVVLEPEQWLGQKLPIAEAIHIDLSQGEWTVLLYRHDCQVCEEEVPRFVERATTGERIVLVEVPPYGDSKDLGSNCLWGRLSDTHDWFVQTPIELQLQDGIVTAVKRREH